ncbi:MAG: acylphosphatase [Myxococcales bacterium]|nr:acylphosphatase [Myxococcales bacterium]
MIAKHVEVFGRVQGVWFRAKTKEQAQQFKVNGWVRNTDGGGVEAHLEGEEDSVERLLTWMHMGPPLARVEHVDEADVPPEGYTSFDILV